MRTLFFDTETTGFVDQRAPLDHETQPHIVQIAAQLCDDDGAILAGFSLIVDPGVPIPPVTSAIHGITDERAALAGVNPKLAKADRQSFFLSALRAAQDGLLPDGREGALVLYGQMVQWLPMVAGIKKRVRQSGEIATWDAQVVRQNDDFDFALGDNPFIKHKPKMDGERGPIVAAYSIAKLKSGEISREIMTRTQIDQVKRASKSSGNGPWKDWEEEMCRKSVLKRHAKSLPMSTEAGEFLQRDNASDAYEASMSAPIAAVIDPLSDDEPQNTAVDWRSELDLYTDDLREAEDSRALEETIARDGARFVDAPAEVQAEARKIETAERVRVPS